MSLPQTASNSEFLKQPSRSEPPITCIPVNSLIDDTDPTRYSTPHRTAEYYRARRLRPSSGSGTGEGIVGRPARKGARRAAHGPQSRGRLSVAVRGDHLSISERDAALAAGERYVQTIGEMQKRLDVAARSFTNDSSAAGHCQVSAGRNGRKFTNSNSRSRRFARRVTPPNSSPCGRGKACARRGQDGGPGIRSRKGGKESRQTAEEPTSVRRQLDASNLDRDATARQVEELLVEVDAERKKRLIWRTKTPSLRTPTMNKSLHCSEARQQVVSISMERDAARTRMLDQAREIERMREQIELLRAKHAVAESKSAQLEEVSRQLATLAAERDAHRLAQQQATGKSPRNRNTSCPWPTRSRLRSVVGKRRWTR